jgi:hypothetical protein
VSFRTQAVLCALLGDFSIHGLISGKHRMLARKQISSPQASHLVLDRAGRIEGNLKG